jgi:hypothetical protein
MKKMISKQEMVVGLTRDLSGQRVERKAGRRIAAR